MIKLIDGFYLDATEYGYVVGKPVQIVTKGVQREIMDNPRYYSSLRYALSDTVCNAVKAKVKNKEITELRELLEYENFLIDRLEDLVSDIS